MFSLIPANTFAVAASDISGHWAQVTIQSWMDKGLIKGYPDGTFKPDQNLTRAEFMTLANRAFGYSAVVPITYTDVKAGSWYAPEVAKAKGAGYISGYPDGTMKPENPITREEVATIIARLQHLTSDANAAGKYSDASSISSWSKGGVSAVTSAKIMQGYPDGSFKPQGLMTRAEVVVASDNTLHYTAPPAATSNVAVSAITVTPTTMALTAGGATGTITATVDPSNATNKIVTWSSSNAAVATVAGGVVTPIAAGTATITVTTAQGSFTATCTVTVTVPVVSEAPAPATAATISTAAIAGVTAPVNGATPTATIAATTEYTATILWSGSPVTFAAATAYTATITLTPTAGYTLTGVTANFFTVAGATATNAAGSGVVSAVFPATAPVQLTIGTPTLTLSKRYDGTTTAAVTAGALAGVVVGDVVTVTAAATYDTAAVGTGKTITVVYTLGGADAAKYVTPVNYTVATGVITATPPARLGQIVATDTDVALTVTATPTAYTIIGDGAAQLTVTTGTVAAGLAASDLTVTGLPTGLTLAAVKGSGNTVDITVTGPASAAVANATTFTVVIKASAVTEFGATDSAAHAITISRVAPSSDATITGGALEGVALAGNFTGGAGIGASTELTVTVFGGEANDIFGLTKGNANSIVKYVVMSSGTPANDAAYTLTYGTTTIDTRTTPTIIWLLVTAEDATTKLYYKITATAASSDATLKASSTVKGQTVTSLGTPNATLGSETAGAVTITATQAADVTNAGSFITLFDKTDTGATVTKVVKYATSGNPTATFASDIVFDPTATITTADFFIVKVTAAYATVLYYKVVVTVTPAPSSDASIEAGTLGGMTLTDLPREGVGYIGSSAYISVVVAAGSRALELTKGNANSVIKWVLVHRTDDVAPSPQPADEAAYTGTYTSGSTNITVAVGDAIWLLVTAEDGTKRYYWINVIVAPTPVAFSTLTANGTSGTVSTTVLTLTFDVEPTTLAWGNIEVTGATKGTLTGTGTTRTLAISGITVANGANVTVAIANPSGFAITPVSKTVAVNVAPLTVTVSKLTTVQSDENDIVSQVNQNAVTVSQTGNTVTVSGNLVDLNSFFLPNDSQNTHKWVGLTADTGDSYITAVGTSGQVAFFTGKYVLWIPADLAYSPITFTFYANGTSTAISVKFTTTITAATIAIAAPVIDGTPATTIASGTGYAGTINWTSPASGNFVAGTPAATVVLTAYSLYTFTGMAATGAVTIDGSTSATYVVSGTGGTILTITVGYAALVAAALITSSTYDVATGNLVLTGVNFNTGAAIDVTKLTITGYGTTTLSAATANPTPASATSATVVVAGADKILVDTVLNRNGTVSSDGITYNLRAAIAWQPGAAEDATTPITVSNAAPTFYSAAASDATHIVITMRSALTGTVGDPLAFTVAGVASGPAVTGVAVSGTSVTLTLDHSIVGNDIPTVAYTHTSTTDLTNGTLVADFTAQAVTNKVPLAIGDIYGGGRVAYILKSGEKIYDAYGNVRYSYDVSVQHGLIAALSDQSTGTLWYNGINTTTGATEATLGRGMANTRLIIASQGDTGSYAAKKCKDYNVGSFSDWYLPSKDELAQLYANRVAIGNFTTTAGTYYWSSTEDSSNYYAAFSLSFDGTNQNGAAPKTVSYHVRAVRSF